MYKQVIPADVVARDVQSRGPTEKVKETVPNHEVSAAQMAEAESKYTVALQKQLAAEGVEALIEKPIDVPVFLKIISDLLAETSERRLERVCGDNEYCRHVARHYEPFLGMLNDRHSARLKLSSALNAALSALPLARDATTDHVGNLVIASHSLPDSHKPNHSYENDPIDREEAPESRHLEYR
jgi:hypothetical protein